MMKTEFLYMLLHLVATPVDCSARWRLQREQREPKAPQERSDEEIEAVPAEASTLSRNQHHSDFTVVLPIMTLTIR